jgi:RNA processing factor Prp31
LKGDYLKIFATYYILNISYQTQPENITMKKIQRERTPLYISDAKKCASQMVRESLAEILAGTYQTPSPEEMTSILKRDFDHSFDEFLARRKIVRSHLDWSEDQIETEIEMQKRRFEDELGVNLRVAALNTIEEIEKLITSLNNAIKKWKIEYL